MHEKQILERVIEAIEVLLEVKYFRSSEQAAIELIFLKFSKSDVYVYVNQEDDTLVVDQRHPQISEELNQFTPHKIWEEAYGQHIRWYWNMVNNQGYEDGLQFEFAQDVNDNPICLQLIAIASTISVSSVIAL